MGGFIARQPNGLLCRFSTVVDNITDYNMTDEEYIEMCAERGRQQARDVLEHHLHSYDEVLKSVYVSDETEREEFEIVKKIMEQEPPLSNMF